MKRAGLLLLLAVFTLSAGIARPQETKDKIGSWSLSQEIDPFSDTRNCTLSVTGVSETAHMAARFKEKKLNVIILFKSRLEYKTDNSYVNIRVRFGDNEPAIESWRLGSSKRSVFSRDPLKTIAALRNAARFAVQVEKYDNNMMTESFKLESTAEAFAKFDDCRGLTVH